jgi:hypothetical protein
VPDGIVQFVVGTGGTSLRDFTGSQPQNSVVRDDATHGILKLTLGDGEYAWQFLPVAGETFTDSGSESCH